MAKKGSKRKADSDDFVPDDLEPDDEEELELEIVEQDTPEFKVLGFIYDHINSSLTATQMKLSGMKRVMLEASLDAFDGSSHRSRRSKHEVKKV